MPELKAISTLGSGSSLNTNVPNGEILGTVDISKLKEAKRYFSDIIRNKKIEHSIVIESSGLVKHFSGTKNNVSMGGVDYKGATIVHNHPESEGIVSFGKDDFEFLKEYTEVRELVAVNSKYNYFAKALKEIQQTPYSQAYSGGLGHLKQGEDFQHAVFLWLSEKGIVEYVREKIK